MPIIFLRSRPLLTVFLIAAAVRWLYALILYGALGDAGLLVADSFGYLQFANQVASAVSTGSLDGWGWLGPELSVMPLITWLWAGSVLVFGKSGALAFILFQGLADAATCLCIYAIAATIRTDYALPAGIGAALNPTQIVLTGLFYTDTFFLFFSAVALLAMARWMRQPSLRMALFAGAAVGCAAMTRILIVPWALCALGLLLGVAVIRRHSFASSVRQLVAAAAGAGLLISPLLARNVIHYGAWSLTAQTGAHSAFWIVPLVRQTKDGTLWEKGAEEMQRREQSTVAVRSENPFQESRRLSELAREAMEELGTAAAVRAWVFGAAVNLGAPAATLSPPVISLSRTGFYATPGATPIEKIGNFLFRPDNALYAWIVLAGIAGLAAIRLVQLIGFFALLRQPEHWPILLLLASWIVYILLVNGPVASPKYRLPIEAPLMVLAGAGFASLCHWRRRRTATQEGASPV
ncbi:MAG: glycosyltransferase family 39 protein [Xanthobacteraceae bacterium]|nr:glycosyltransferase family 39 protein [Xanthobacteraceae bacterium]